MEDIFNMYTRGLDMFRQTYFKIIYDIFFARKANATPDKTSVQLMIKNMNV